MLEGKGQKVVVDSISLPFLENATIDFTRELIGARFVIENPNATSSCGCGTSFLCDGQMGALPPNPQDIFGQMKQGSNHSTVMPKSFTWRGHRRPCLNQLLQGKQIV